jgi:hypothetical protein
MRLVCGLYITKSNENDTTREYIGVDGRHAAPKGASDKKKERLDWADVDEQIFYVCLFSVLFVLKVVLCAYCRFC